jgi:hypothetical protein
MVGTGTTFCHRRASNYRAWTSVILQLGKNWPELVLAKSFETYRFGTND